MCGIIAIYSNRHEINRQQVLEACKAIVHRGPDEQTAWLSENKKVALGHTRLSIIDLNTGTQPLSSADGSIHLIVNGEFYDFERIREEMKLKGYKFKTFSDSEILIALYQEYGTNSLQYLRGEFAFVLWDEKNQRFFAARDRFGIKPLFYTFHNNCVYFASEIKALLVFDIPRQIDTLTVKMTENLTYPEDRTAFKNIFPIKPGYYVIATPETLTQHCYWDFKFPKVNSSAGKINEQDMVQQLRDKLTEAVNLRLRADVPVGCYLSGGLDSCSVLALMAKIRGQNIQTFTLSFEGPLYDEAAIANEMSTLVGATQHIYNVNAQIMADNFADAVWHNEIYFSNNNTIAKFILSKKVYEEHFKVVLTGEGSDEILGGYLPFRQDMLLHNTEGQDRAEVEKLLKLMRDANQASAGIYLTDTDLPELPQLKAKLGYSPMMFRTYAVRGSRLAQLQKESYRQFDQSPDVFDYLINQVNLAAMCDIEPLNKSLYLWAKSLLSGFILLCLGDRMEMAHSIEGRVPFLDHHVVEFLSQIPVSMKIRGITEKYILREAMKGIITDRVYDRQKHPFLAPPVKVTHSNPMYNLMQETFNGDLLKNNEIYDQTKVLQLFNQWSTMDATKQQIFDPILMHVLSTCYLHKLYNMQLH